MEDKFIILNDSPQTDNFTRRLRLKLYDHRYRNQLARITNELLTLGSFPLFNHVEIETINRCNGSCSFCPVNQYVDPRKLHVMDEGMFESVIKQLSDMKYNGSICCYSNGEPLLDKYIYEHVRYARDWLPEAYHFLCTNGTLLDIDGLKSLTKSLNCLVIDVYMTKNQIASGILPRNIIDVYEHCLQHENQYSGKVQIKIICKDDVRTNRGGDAPNSSKNKTLRSSCLRPFKQLIIKSSGDIGSCCAKPLCRLDLGNAGNMSLLDCWYGEKFMKFRKDLAVGRYNTSNCYGCDDFDVDMKPFRVNMDYLGEA